MYLVRRHLGSWEGGRRPDGVRLAGGSRAPNGDTGFGPSSLDIKELGGSLISMPVASVECEGETPRE